jgi:hypothetical protein
MQSDLANYRRYLQPCIPDLNQQSRQIDRIPTNSADILCLNLDSRFDILESQFITLVQLINTQFKSISSPAAPDSSACRLPVVSSISSSDQIVINLSLAEFEPRGKINDFDTCHLFLFLFHRYKELGGSKKLSTLLQVPFDSNKPYLSNFSSLFFEFDDNYLLDDVYIENKLCSIYPETLSPLTVTSRLKQLCMQDTDRMVPTKLLDLLDTFLATFRYYGSEFKRKYETELQWNKELCKLFCSLVRPADLPIRMNLDGIYKFDILQQQFRTKVLQFQITQSMLGTTAPSLSRIHCKNCNLSHHVRDCRKNCKHSSCAALPSHSASKCINWHPQRPQISFLTDSKFSRVLSVTTPSPDFVSPDLDTQVDSTSAITASPSGELLPNRPLQTAPCAASTADGPCGRVNNAGSISSASRSADCEVIFDSGSAVTTLPSSHLLSGTSTLPILPLQVETADGTLHTSTNTGIFHGLSSHVLPSFPDILICLSDYLSQGRIAIIDSSMMQIFNKTISADNAIDQFRNQFINDSVLTIPVQEKIYSLPVQQFLSSSVNHNKSTVSSTLPSLPFSPAYVVRNYQTANFADKRQLVRFFHELFGHPSLNTMLSIVTSSSIVNMHPDLTPTAIRKFFPHDCPACPAG